VEVTAILYSWVTRTGVNFTLKNKTKVNFRHFYPHNTEAGKVIASGDNKIEKN
jgi:hypothetical protein